MQKRILSLLLALAMVLTLLPISAAAKEADLPAGTLPPAEGGVITITTDGIYTLTGSMTDQIVVNKGVTAVLNINGTVSAPAGVKNPIITNNGTLTIQGENGKVLRETSEDTQYAIKNSGTMVVNDGVDIVSKSAEASCFENEGNLEINGSTII